MCCIWDIAIRTPSLLPLYVPFELCEKFGIWFGPPPTFWDNVPHFWVFFSLKAYLSKTNSTLKQYHLPIINIPYHFQPKLLACLSDGVDTKMQ